METILDSKKCLSFMEKHNINYAISGSFTVAAGETAHLVLTTSREQIKRTRIYIHRTPKPLTKEEETSCLEGIYTRLHHTPPNSPIGDPTLMDASFVKSTMVLGNSNEGGIFDYLMFTKPGSYYLYAAKEENLFDDTSIVELGIEKQCC